MGPGVMKGSGRPHFWETGVVIVFGVVRHRIV